MRKMYKLILSLLVCFCFVGCDESMPIEQDGSVEINISPLSTSRVYWDGGKHKWNKEKWKKEKWGKRK
jgi:hypothetical protein